MASIAVDIDNDDIASLANRTTVDGTAVATGPSKQTTYVPRYTVPNTALGESYKICGVEGIVATEHQLSRVCSQTARIRTLSTIQDPTS